MKSEIKIVELYNFIGFFNDGRFMNQDYREGIMDALSYVLYNGEKLERTLNRFGIALEEDKGVDLKSGSTQVAWWKGLFV